MKRSEKIRLALIELNLESEPKCYCGGDLEFLSKFKHITQYGGWRTYCSKSCMYNSPEVKSKRKSTIMERYGVESYSHIQDFKPLSAESKAISTEKRKKTSLKRYGVEHFSKTQEYIDKRTATNIERYGVDNTYKLVEDNTPWFSTDAGKEWLKSESNPAKNEETSRKWKIKRLTKKVNDVKFIDALMSDDPDIFKSYIDSIAEEGDNRFTLSNKIGISYTYLNMIFRMFKMFDEYTSPTNYSISNGEKEVYEFVKGLGVPVIPSHRKLLGGYEVDAYCPEHNIAIEYNGLYWHSEFTGNKDRQYHLNKTNLCEAQGVQLFQIYDTEWSDPVKQSIWKSIIKIKLGMVDRKIHARKCMVVRISPAESRELLEQNHLEGFVGAEFHYGLVYNDELVSVMSFGKSRFSHDEYEIIRYATTLNTIVVGGRSKLLKCYNINGPLISFANRRFSSALTNNLSDVYSYTAPTWYGFSRKDYQLRHRMTFQKHKMKDLFENYDDDIGVFDNMIVNGYDRVWDSGNIKYYIK